LDLIQDLADKRAANVLAFVVRQGSVAAIRVTVEDIAAFLPNDSEAPLQQDAFEGPRINDRKLAHTAIEKD
jgi:hypothetical protein